MNIEGDEGTDEFWVGALSKSAAIAHHQLITGRGDLALLTLDEALERFERSSVIDDDLREQLSEYWVSNVKSTSSSSDGSLGSALHSITGTTSQDNAKRQAENYLETMAFSRRGLIEQLTYEGYSLADATYAVDNVSVDWNEQAAKKAQEYLNTSAFSRSGLLEQLQYEGFTPSQATYGVSVAY